MVLETEYAKIIITFYNINREPVKTNFLVFYSMFPAQKKNIIMFTFVWIYMLHCASNVRNENTDPRLLLL